MKKIKNNQGSSLILVVIAISFISLLGVLILSLTMTNLQIKQIDYNARNTFYDSEGVVDELRAQLADCSSLAIQESYENVMKNYASYSSSGSDTLKKQFEKGYINSLLKQIGISEDATGTKFDPDAYTDTDHYNFYQVNCKHY